LLEGEARFEDENIYVFEMIRQFFDIETLTDRIRTCLHQDKKYLWNEMKSLGNLLRKRPCFSYIVFARMITYSYLSHFALIMSKAQMVIIAKYLSKNQQKNEDDCFDKCRMFMDETKSLLSILISEVCPIMVEVSKNVLEFTSLDTKIEEKDCFNAIFMQLKRRADVSINM
jgi:hypothetical protein